MGTLHVVAEREERVRAERDPLDGAEVGTLFRTRKGSGLLGKEPLPVRREQGVVVLVTRRVYVDGVVAVGAAHIVLEREGEHLRALAQLPDIRLVSRQTRAVDARLLSRADPDRLSVDGVADRVGLGVFQCDEREQEVAAGLGGDVLVRRRAVAQTVLCDRHFVALLLEGHAVHVLALQRGRRVALVHLEDEIAALALAL